MGDADAAVVLVIGSREGLGAANGRVHLRSDMELKGLLISTRQACCQASPCAVYPICTHCKRLLSRDSRTAE